MSIQAPKSACVRFGVFELDTQTGELRRSGILIHLAPLPFRVLLLLASRPGELVTREEIRERIWGSDTFVDFDHGLNVAIKEIRSAIGDDATAPRFIETLSRRGYRFIAPVSGLGDGAGSPGAGDPLPAGTPSGAQLVPSPSRPAWKFFLLVCSALVAIAAILFVLEGWNRSHHPLGFRLGTRVSPTIQSIAVLPLDNLSGIPEQEYFADGLTDTLITNLGQIVTLRVISRASVMRYKRGKIPLPQIARELNVDAVVEGTVQRAGDKIVISVQLLDARADRHLWANTYEHSAGDVLGLEKQVALAIAREISGRVTPAEQTRVNMSRGVNPQAYDDYLHGRYLLGKRTPESGLGARAYFDEARRLDPGFAPAWSGLADTYSVTWYAKSDFGLAEEYSRKAVALDPDLAEGHASLGIAELYGHHYYAEAEKELQRAIALNPNYAMAHHWYSLHQLFQGRAAEALAANDRARELDPFSLPINYLRGLILVQLRDYDGALAQFRFAISIHPDDPALHFGLQRVYWLQGRFADVLEEEKAMATLPHHFERVHGAEEVAAAYRKSGLKAARLKDAEIKERLFMGQRNSGADPSTEIYTAWDIAVCYALLQDKQETLMWLNRVGQDDPLDFPIFLNDPALEWLHSDPQFQVLRGRVGMPQ